MSIYLCVGRNELAKQHLYSYGCWGDHGYLSLLLVPLTVGFGDGLGFTAETLGFFGLDAHPFAAGRRSQLYDCKC